MRNYLVLPSTFQHYALDERGFVSRRASQLFSSSACLSTRSPEPVVVPFWGPVDVFGKLDVELMSETSL
jgi:hypothetical protein